ncbi:MAG: Flp1 family type IVb pilin [Anaerovoracaceae bacterium]
MIMKLNSRITSMVCRLRSKKGMELVQVGILIAIAVCVGLVFKTQIGNFIKDTFNALTGANFNG